MLSSVKLMPNWLPRLVLGMFLTVCLTPANAPAGQSRQYIPSLNATVREVVFYESAWEILPTKDRVYRVEFSQSQARYIKWELRLKHPKPGKRINFRIQAKYYSPTGKLLVDQGINTYLGSNWSTSWHGFGYGYDKPGSWALGTYRVDFFIAQSKAASASFRVISGKGRPTTQRKRPDPIINLPPDLEGL